MERQNKPLFFTSLPNYIKDSLSFTVIKKGIRKMKKNIFVFHYPWCNIIPPLNGILLQLSR